MRENSRQRFHVGARVFDIVEKHLSLFDGYARESVNARHAADIGDVGKDLYLRGQFAVAVVQFVEHIDVFLMVLDPADSSVRIHPLSVVADILGRNIGVDVHFHNGLPDRRLLLGRRRFLFSLDLLYLFFEHAAIEIVPDHVHLAVLFGAEKIAGTAHFHVAKGDPDAGTELGEIADCGQAFLGDFGQDFVAAVCDIGVGLPVGAAHAAFQLIELGEAEAVGVLDDHRVDVRHIDSGLDDRRADEDVRLMKNKALDDVFELVLAHLAVRVENPGAGKRFFELGDLLLYAVRVVEEIEDLALARDLAKAGFG